jgi:hypothetical protein
MQPLAWTSSNGTCTTQKEGEAMSFRFLERYGLAGLLAFSLVSAAYSQFAPSDRAMSANDLAGAVVANELKAQDGSHGRWMYRVDKEEQGK